MTIRRFADRSWPADCQKTGWTKPCQPRTPARSSAFLFLSFLVVWSCGSPLRSASRKDASAGSDVESAFDIGTGSDLVNPGDPPSDLYRAKDGYPDLLVQSDSAKVASGEDVHGPDDAGNSEPIDGPGYPLAQPGNALTDILPFIVNSGGCMQCLKDGCPSAITCANDPICATEISCLVAPCYNPPPVMQTSPQMCVSDLAWNCGSLTNMMNCPTTCSFVSPAAAVTGLQGAACVYQQCHYFCFESSP